MNGYMRAISIALMLLAASPASAQVINGESTYGDSDLHQPPAEDTPPPSEATRRDAPAQPRQPPGQR